MDKTIKQRIASVKNGKVPDGYKIIKNIGILPNHWREGQLFDIVRNEARSIKKPQSAYWRLGLRSHAKGTFHELVENPESVEMDELFSVCENDLIVNITFAWEHAIAVADKNDAGLLVSHRFPTYVFKEGNSSQFYKYVVIQKWFKDLLEQISPGGAGRNRVMSKPAFLKLPCFIPPTLEQKKIAEILGCCDKVIFLKKELIAEKKKQKKTLMQKLLNPQSGFRLPGFSEKWKRKKIGDLTTENGEYGINAPACSFEYGLPRYIRITDIDSNGKFIPENEAYVRTDNLEKYILHENDILFVRTGGTVGKSYLYDKLDGKLVFAGFLIRFKLTPKKIDPVFFENIVDTFNYWNWVKTMSARSGQPGINAEEYASYQFLCPEFKEQQAIADILSTADKEIDLLEQELLEWEKKKKALMQLLLTGIVRVKV